MPDSKIIKLKICLVGEGAVGKTSLIKRFVFDAFDGKYITTLGTKITKKEVTIKHPSKGDKVNVTILIWDIMGQKGFRELLQEAYFYGAQGLIAVCDITNKETMEELDGWIESAFNVTGKVPIIFLANKSDLENKAQFTLDEFGEFAAKYEKSAVFSSSAKTGENVNKAFETLSLEIIKE
ncbi:MAG: GTP-binding protein [Methanomassiliicoccales archaeon]|nr:MAG: GTP-binding protein [Methanomassiliicoccales archaeon]